MKKLIWMVVLLFLLNGCFRDKAYQINVSVEPTEKLIQLLKDPDDPNHLFYDIVEELAKRGPSAAEAAPVLAAAMAYPRHDSILTSEALTVMGPSAKSAIPYLLQNLDSSREDVRRHSVYILGIIGKPAACAVPKIAHLLWDKDGFVRTASAAALAEITNLSLIEDEYRLDPEIPGLAPEDNPDGELTATAREWWLAEGQNRAWPTNNCELPEEE